MTTTKANPPRLLAPFAYARLQTEENEHHIGIYDVAADNHDCLAVIDKTGSDEYDRQVLAPLSKAMAAGPQLVQALYSLLREFDRYDAAMAEHGRGHEDYGLQRDDARALLARVTGYYPPKPY